MRRPMIPYPQPRRILAPEIVGQVLADKNVELRARYTLLASTGLRSEELRTLCWSCVDLELGALLVDIEPAPTRLVPFGQPAIDALQALRAQKRMQGGDERVFDPSSTVPIRLQPGHGLEASRIFRNDLRLFAVAAWLTLGFDHFTIAKWRGVQSPSFVIQRVADAIASDPAWASDQRIKVVSLIGQPLRGTAAVPARSLPPGPALRRIGKVPGP